MEIDHQGEIVGYEVNEGVIRSAERMTYTAVHGVLQGDADLRKRYAPLVANFELMRDLATILNRKRQKRGSIDFDLPEPVIEFDENGLMKGVTRSERNEAHRLIEEFMLAANESVATYLEERRIASLYRIHEKPDPKRVYDFENHRGQLRLFARRRRAAHRTRASQGRQAFAARQRTSPGAHRDPERSAHHPADVPETHAETRGQTGGAHPQLSSCCGRSNRRATRSRTKDTLPWRLSSYTHFTSPIRRYPDLIVHRILKQVLQASRRRRTTMVFPWVSVER